MVGYWVGVMGRKVVGYGEARVILEMRIEEEGYVQSHV
jgi:hypothetical protein